MFLTRQNFFVTIFSISMLAKSRILFSKFNHTKPLQKKKKID